MRLTDQRIIRGVGLAIVALGALGFALGLQQGQRPPTEQQPLPLPVNTGRTMNLQGVPQAAGLDPAAANGAIDPAAARARARRAQADADNTMDDTPDPPDAASPAAPAAPDPAEPVRPVAKPAAPPPGNTLHGPF